MLLLKTASALSRWREELTHRPLHFVPTMGGLHDGHLSLVAAARERQPSGPNGSGAQLRPRVVLSVFVNPLQFGPGEDFLRYPRDLDRDVSLASAAGVDALYAPGVDDIFPGGEEASTRLLVPPTLQKALCGRSRPGHFDGVATVVTRLLSQLKPDRLFLGEKDWQQLLIMRRVLVDLGLPVAVQGCATVRESDGLACSSRNTYLRPEDRAKALALPGALAAAAASHAVGCGDGAALCGQVRRSLEEADLSSEYVELVQAHTLQPMAKVEGLTVLAAAVRCGSSRLIDHVFLMSRSPIVAIDGPAGAGKSTVTRAFARRLGLVYLDTGAMYRALTWWVLHRGVDPADSDGVACLLPGLDLRLVSSGTGDQQVFINGNDVSEAIRTPVVTAAVSTVAAHGCVRQALTEQQQAMGRQGGLVAEGRDIGTAVFPDADLKVFLTATVAERARRRALDLQIRGFEVPDPETLERLIAERDHVDASRAIAPLRRADDAMEVVTDGMEIDAVIQRLVDLFRLRIPEDAWPSPPAGAPPNQAVPAGS